ncbi:hypothetical protein [Desulfosoma caldarium]|uniref:Uncharacterized protein n=1 Tax=Desulfosoma caldarium TaxID=610254 RepID=A0A3N1UEE9_9BACT|nr:hypothetical protein [Desulfosoma caldarium]ROQ89614.1 hypothetical protein EDC27_3152 [Desulfosoma caldarium]
MDKNSEVSAPQAKIPASELASTAGHAVCPRCAGTGLICGVEPVIGPGACCADYANAVCPQCGGSGKNPDRE